MQCDCTVNLLYCVELEWLETLELILHGHGFWCYCSRKLGSLSDQFSFFLSSSTLLNIFVAVIESVSLIYLLIYIQCMAQANAVITLYLRKWEVVNFAA
jgi:hypothetical protein